MFSAATAFSLFRSSSREAFSKVRMKYVFLVLASGLVGSPSFFLKNPRNFASVSPLFGEGLFRHALAVALYML